MTQKRYIEKQKKTFETMFETTKLVEEAVLAKEGIRKIFMVIVLSAMSVAFSRFVGVFWEIDSPLILMLPTILFNFSLYSIYDRFVQKEETPVHVNIASAFLKKYPEFYERTAETNDSYEDEQ